MPVWSEPGRQYNNTAPRGADIELSMFNRYPILQYASARSAAESLVVLALDTWTLVTNPLIYAAGAAVPGPGNPPLAGAQLDGPELIWFLFYLSYLAFDELAIQAVNLLGAGPAQAPYNAYLNNMQNIFFAALLSYDHLRNLAPGAADANLLAYLGNLDLTRSGAGPAPRPAVPQQTGLGTVELLCRIAANNCNTLAQVMNNFQNLQLAQLPAPGAQAGLGWWDCYNKGITKTVFVCSGSDGVVVGTPPTIVVTTSQDEWGNFLQMQNWSRRCRQPLRRLDWNGGPGNGDTMGLTNESLAVRTQYRNAVAALAVPTTIFTRRNARNGVINARAPFRALHNADHIHEHATPLTCPVFQPKARCLRCQAFFNYHVTQIGALAGEHTMKGWRSLKCHLARACAECIAHYACCHALANAGVLVAGNPSH